MTIQDHDADLRCAQELQADVAAQLQIKVRLLLAVLCIIITTE